ncbi:MAG: hypothetical protein M1826_005403 [Phylliscum demangeonii]|nr:MAG: hypothetical protein M1826_005403 [Phylliscum demangeonii]
MPSGRRWRVLAVFIASLVMLVLYFSADSRNARTRDFYATTLRQTKIQDEAEERARTAGPLRDVTKAGPGPAPADVAHPPKPEALPHPKPAAHGDQKPLAAGGGGDAPGPSPAATNGGGSAEGSASAEAKEKEKQQNAVDIELGQILKRSPIIIFSKSYCRFSKRAKAILLAKYHIVPPPFVVELDEHPLGAALQNELHRRTGRRTVPNVLISGKTIGGGDEVASLDAKGELVDTLRRMVGKRLMKAELRRDS